MENFNILIQFIKENKIDPLIVAIILKIIFSRDSEK